MIEIDDFLERSGGGTEKGGLSWRIESLNRNKILQLIVPECVFMSITRRFIITVRCGSV